jgi:alpha-L-fucosidase
MSGIIFHWGLYSVPAYDDPKLIIKRKIQNGSEWYKKRLLEKGDFRPVSGWKETQKYHRENYNDQKYEDFAKEFAQTPINFDKWMELCKSVGASYVIITAKHHDGFCLFETEIKMEKTNFVKDFGISAKKYGLKFGIYYSWYEFDRNFTIDYVDNIVQPQIKELLSYKPDIFWFDGDWVIKTKYGKNVVAKICSNMKKLGIEINDRVCDPSNGTYRVFADRYIPKSESKEK